MCITDYVYVYVYEYDYIIIIIIMIVITMRWEARQAVGGPGLGQPPDAQ